jgi:5-hydroxyisourate hydrolase
MEHKLSLSTHILDVARGKPADGVVIKFYKLENDLWFESQENAVTDHDGRFKNFLKLNENIFGTYKLKFEVGEYFRRIGSECLYPFVEVRIDFN